MGSEFQYKVFKDTYDEENSRYTELEKRGQFYFGLQTFYLGAIAFKLDDVLKFAATTSVPSVFFVIYRPFTARRINIHCLGRAYQNLRGSV
jgi:hypothetical protein